MTRERRTVNKVLDRRRQGRVPQLRPVRLFEPFAGRFYGGVSVNVSVDGMCVRLPADVDLRPGRFVTLHANSGGPRLAGTGMQALTARVVWTEIDPSDDRHLTVGLALYAASIAAAA